MTEFQRKTIRIFLLHEKGRDAMRNLPKLAGLFLIAAMLLSGCSAEQDSSPAISPQGGEETMQEETTQSALPTQEETLGNPTSLLQEESEVRNGTSDDTLATPEDFPADYDYGSGLDGDWGTGTDPGYTRWL